jgi:hypothetical protein
MYALFPYRVSLLILLLLVPSAPAKSTVRGGRSFRRSLARSQIDNEMDTSNDEERSQNSSGRTTNANDQNVNVNEFHTIQGDLELKDHENTMIPSMIRRAKASYYNNNIDVGNDDDDYDGAFDQYLELTNRHHRHLNGTDQSLSYMMDHTQMDAYDSSQWCLFFLVVFVAPVVAGITCAFVHTSTFY